MGDEERNEEVTNFLATFQNLDLGREQQQGYDSYISQLFDLIDEIEASKIMDHVVPIPNVVAAGDQASGKSSVLGKLTGIALPVGDQGMTLCATQLELRKSQRQYCQMEYPKVKEIANISDIGDEISEIQAELVYCNTSGSIYDVMPRFKIESSEVRNLRVIDLPGLRHSIPSDQDDSMVEEVQNMVLKYIRPEKAIILCVIDATRDWALDKIFQLVRDVDPTGTRTLVVITKIDKLKDDKPKIRSIMDEIRSQQFHPFLHYVFVNSLMDTDANELAFFESIVTDTGLPLENCTIKNLYNKLCYMLLKSVMEEFKTAWETIDEFRNKIIQEKTKQPSFMLDITQVIDKKIAEFIETSRQIFQGQFGDFDLYSKHRDCFEKFKLSYDAEMDEQNNHFLARIGSQWRRLEPGNFHSWESFRSYSMPIIRSFQGPAAHYHIAIRETNKELINALIRDNFQDQKEFINLLENKISDVFESQDRLSIGRLESLYKNEIKYFYTEDDLYEKCSESLEDEKSPQIQRSRRILQSFKKKNPQMATAMGIVQDSSQDPDEPDEQCEDVQYTNEELSEVLGNLGSIMMANMESKDSGQKTVTYEKALRVLRAMALDRIPNTVRSIVLACMNDEVLEKMEMIARDITEFQKLNWKQPSEEIRREEFDMKEKMIQKWREQILKIKTEIDTM